MENNHKRLRDLSDDYEVDFDPAAWDKMEKLLPDAASYKPPFFKYIKLIAAMMLLIFAVYFALSGAWNTETPIAETKPVDNRQITVSTDKTEPESKDKTPEIARPQEKK